MTGYANTDPLAQRCIAPKIWPENFPAVDSDAVYQAEINRRWLDMLVDEAWKALCGAEEAEVRRLLGMWVSEHEPTLIYGRHIEPDNGRWEITPRKTWTQRTYLIGLGFEGDLSMPPTVVMRAGA